MAADHPRIRGEHPDHGVGGRRRAGSSPHTRGALEGQGFVAVRVRIIPAYAGSTLIPCSRATSSSDHPRIRGEHAPGSILLVLGSWIIPAYAGSTWLSRGWRLRRGDHPRIRGEHLRLFAQHSVQVGSSPHTRGAPGRRRRRRPQSADHPRIRGEHLHSMTAGVSPVGSSPHTRGAPAEDDHARVGALIIPAYAGSTPTPTWSKNRYWDHPRIRGEHVIKIGADLSAQGSSPHTRGAPPSRLRRRFRERIIPAYAGSTGAS